MELWRKITASGSKDKFRQEIIDYNNRLKSEYAPNHVDAQNLTADEYFQAMQEKYQLPDQHAYLHSLNELLRYCTYLDFFQNALYNEDLLPKVAIAGMHLSVLDPSNPEPSMHFDRDVANGVISDLNMLKYYSNQRRDLFRKLSKRSMPERSALVKLDSLIKGIGMFFGQEKPTINLYSQEIPSSDFITASAHIMVGCEGMGINPLVSATMAHVWKRDIFRGSSK